MTCPINYSKCLHSRVANLSAASLTRPFLEGVVPSEWKCATVVPIPKVNPPPSMDKLQPVSLTPALAKVAETFINSWIMEDMKPNLDPRQFGNRKARSTTHYLVLLVQLAFQALEDGLGDDFLATGYIKAFDRVDITVAIHKLLQMGVRRELLLLVGDFLSGRRQRTRVNGITSNWFEVTLGVPQGTKLGPVIFLAMVNSVAEHHGDRCKWWLSTNPLFQQIPNFNASCWPSGTMPVKIT